MKIPLGEFVFKPCRKEDLNEILKMQEEAFEEIESEEMLRKNTPEMLLECLTAPHITLGAWHKGRLAAISVLYFPNEEEDLSLSLEGIDIGGRKSANGKLCIVRKEYQGNSLQYLLGTEIDKIAKLEGIKVLCVTAHPENTFSVRNILKLGYKYNRTLKKYGAVRNLYYKFI